MQFLVIAKIIEGTSWEKILPYIKSEAEKVWEFYTTEVVRSIHYLEDMSGVVLMLEAENLENAQATVAEFPMVQNDILNFEILPLKPYTGLETLFTK